MLLMKSDILQKLKDKGYTTSRIRTEKIMGEQMLQKLREGLLPSWGTLDTLCRLLQCQPGDLIEYVDDQ